MLMASYGPDGQQQWVVEKWKSRPKKVRGIPTFPPPRRRLRVLSPIPQANLQFSPSFLTHTFQSRPGGYDVGRLYHTRPPLGVPRDIVSPRVVQVIIQEDRWKQAELERPTRLELLDDLPGAEVLLVRVGADQVEVELVGESFGEEIATPRERFQIEELIFDEAVNGFHIALEGVSGGRDADVLAVA